MNEQDYTNTLQAIYEQARLAAFMQSAIDARLQYEQTPMKHPVKRGVHWQRVGNHKTLAGCKIAIPIEWS